MKKKTTKILLSAAMVTLLVAASAMPAFAAGDVAGAIEQTWTQAQTQIKTVVNNVVFPAVSYTHLTVSSVSGGALPSPLKSASVWALPTMTFCPLPSRMTAPWW